MKLQRQIDRLLAHRASEWHQILESADEEQRAGFVAWLKQSPLHLQEYLETVYTDQVLAHVDTERMVDVDALLAQAAPGVIPFGETLPSTVAAQRRPRRWIHALAATVVLCAVALPLIHGRLSTAREHSTAVGEQRTLQLADSSVVTLNADTRIRVNLDEAHRDIELIHGEALFKVAQDIRRPFRVHTDTATVQAIGTQFNVYERPEGTRVSVLEGRVKVVPRGAAGGNHPDAAQAGERLGAGQEALVRLDGTIQRNAAADVMQTVAWRERRLIFKDAPLEDMVYEFNRYGRAVRLTLDGVPPGTHHYNGIFDAADPESLADLLSREPDLSIERRDGEIIIRKRR